MALAGWLVAIGILIVIIFIILGISWWNRNHQTPSSNPPNRFNDPLIWSAPIPGPDPAKNVCQLYEFPSGTGTINGVTTVIPGTPTFDPNILNNLSGTQGYPVCLDPDQIMAIQLQHTCANPVATSDDSISRCFLQTGGTTGLGGTETYYSNINIPGGQGCLTISPCVGQLAVLSVNYQAPTIPPHCIVNNGLENATMTLCDPTQPNQLFRITRINYGQNPNTMRPG